LLYRGESKQNKPLPTALGIDFGFFET
jgi:hypothetical protein